MSSAVCCQAMVFSLEKERARTCLRWRIVQALRALGRPPLREQLVRGAAARALRALSPATSLHWAWTGKHHSRSCLTQPWCSWPRTFFDFGDALPAPPLAAPPLPQPPLEEAAAAALVEEVGLAALAAGGPPAVPKGGLLRKRARDLYISSRWAAFKAKASVGAPPKMFYSDMRRRARRIACDDCAKLNPRSPMYLDLLAIVRSNPIARAQQSRAGFSRCACRTEELPDALLLTVLVPRLVVPTQSRLGPRQATRLHNTFHRNMLCSHLR